LFTPDPDKTFHRGTTDYFVNGRGADIGAFDSPKFIGEPIGKVTQVGANWFEMAADHALSNGDGLNYIHKREVFGVPANRAEQKGAIWRIEPNVDIATLPGFRAGTVINRNGDHAWEQALTKKSAERRIGVDLRFTESSDGFCLRITDEAGVTADAALNAEKTLATQADKVESSLRENLGKLGATDFFPRKIDIQLSAPWFLPASSVNALRRSAIARLEAARAAAYRRPARKAAIDPPAPYPGDSLSYLANVYNDAARAFYARHGVKLMDAAFEAHEESGEVSLMVTKHCLRFSFNLCPKQAKGITGVQGQIRAEPMTLVSGGEKYTLNFDCRPCEMHVMGKMKKHILKTPPPSTVSTAPLVFHRQRPGSGV
jgi:putative protease